MSAAGWMLGMAWAVAGAPEVPEAQWVTRSSPPEVCLSAVPSDGRIRGKDRQAFLEARDGVAERLEDPLAMRDWWAGQAGARAGVKPHDAWSALDAFVATWSVDDDTRRRRLEDVADAHRTDACLSHTAAVVAHFAGDEDAARRWLGRAWIAGPSGPSAWLLATLLEGGGELDRQAAIVDKGLAVDPDHAPLRRLRASVALARGETSAVEDDLAWLRQAGDTSLDGRLMEARFRQRKMDDYLRLAAAQGAPLGPARAAAEAGEGLPGLREAFGLPPKGGVLRAVLHTSMGDIRCDLLVDEAPVTVANFVGLAEGTQAWTDPRTGEAGEGPLYKDILFHRVIPDFMVQGGDPTGTGRAGPGYRFHDEIDPSLRFDRTGLLAMANAGPGTNGSQFFVTDGPAEHLSGRHTIFGRCVDVDVVSTIADVPTNGQDKPFTDVVLQSIAIERIGD